MKILKMLCVVVYSIFLVGCNNPINNLLNISAIQPNTNKVPISKLNFNYTTADSFLLSKDYDSLASYLNTVKSEVKVTEPDEDTYPTEYLSMTSKIGTHQLQQTKLIFSSEGLSDVTLMYVGDLNTHALVIADMLNKAKIFGIDATEYKDEYTNILDTPEGQTLNYQKVYSLQHTINDVPCKIEVKLDKSDTKQNPSYKLYFHMKFKRNKIQSQNIQLGRPEYSKQQINRSLYDKAHTMISKGFIFNPKTSYIIDDNLNSHTLSMYRQREFPFSIDNQYWRYSKQYMGDILTYETMEFKIPSHKVQEEPYMKEVFQFVNSLLPTVRTSYDTFKYSLPDLMSSANHMIIDRFDHITEDGKQMYYLISYKYIPHLDVYIITVNVTDMN